VAAKDTVDHVLAQWRTERPDLELRPMGIFGRLGRLSPLLARAIDEGLGAHGLSTLEFDVLASLRRAGAPFRLTPSKLAAQLMLSPAAMTHRLDGLEKRGFLVRELDPDDRRSFSVTLTKAGRKLVDTAVVDHLENERALLAPLGAAEQVELDRLLRKLLAAHDKT
jgi:DNA-binding MarR family transcriptional regulator